MAKLIVLLSGRICTGKSTLAERLVKHYKFRSFSTRELLGARLKKGQEDRGTLQAFGQKMDKNTKGAWLRNDLEESIRELGDDARVVIDSVRVRDQIERFRESYRPWLVHVHLDCDDRVLAQRYKRRRKKPIRELRSFAATGKNQTEAAVRELGPEADILIRTDYSGPEDVLIRVACLLGLHGREHFPYVDVIIGGQFGSEGKGQVAAYLAPEYDLLVRVGGPNAGHKVFEEEAPYTFHQLPSGTTRAPSSNLLIGAGAALRMDVLRREIADSKVGPDRLAIDPQAIIITQADINWEKRILRGTISSTAQGTGHAAIRRIRRQPRTIFARDVPELKPYIRSALDVLEAARLSKARVMLEGTQGTGLSLFHGHYPFVTSRDTTAGGCISESGIPPGAVRRVIMVCRTFPIRVQSPRGGTSGPMTQQISLSEIAARSGLPLSELRKTEKTSTTNRRRRIAEFDWQQLRRSAQLNAPTDIAITFADYISLENRHAHRFDQLTSATLRFMSEVERVACAPVSLVSVGFNYRAVLDRRSW